MDSRPDVVFFDPNIPRKGQVLDKHLDQARDDGSASPFFSLIEFNLSGLCNRTCVFCPRSDPKVFPNINEHIPIALYESILTDLGAVDYAGMILFSAFSEPLLNKSIETLIEISKRHCPKVRIESVTDGDFVTTAKLRALFDAGLDTLLISMYDGPEQEGHFQGLVAESGVSPEKVVLRKRWLPPEEHYGITLSNRSGMVEIPQAGVGKLTEPMKRPCHYPFYQILVDYDGSVLLCPHDWGKKLIVGNVNNTSIVDIWNGTAIKRARISLSKSDRNFQPCNVCDVDGTLMGGAHFDKWMAYYDNK